MLCSNLLVAQRQKVVVHRPIPTMFGSPWIDICVEKPPQGFATFSHSHWPSSRSVVLFDGGQYAILNHRMQRILTLSTLEGTEQHSNNATATSHRLLWVSECYGAHRCMVYRLVADTLQYVRQISYQGNEHWFAYDWCVDEAAGRIYVYGGTMGQSLWIKAFDITRSLTGTHGEYTPADVLHTTEIHGVGVPQGSLVRNGKAYLLDGDTPGNTFLHVFDLATGRCLLTMPLHSGNLEPEGLALRGRWVYISFYHPHTSEINIVKYRLPQLR